MPRLVLLATAFMTIVFPVRAQWENISESGRLYTDFAVLGDVMVATNEDQSDDAVLLSTDFGQTWSSQGLGRNGRAVVSTGSGFIVNIGGQSNFTGDATGTTWTDVPGPGGNVTNFYHDPSTGRTYAGTQSVNAVVTEDGGITWSFLPAANRDSEFTWVHARGETIIGGYNQGGGRTYLSTDGGDTFTDVGVNTTAAGFVAKDGDLYLIGPRPTLTESVELLRSTDGGQTWNPIYQPPGLGGIFGGQWTPLRQKSLIFVDGQSIILAVNARVYVSHDGGQTFEDMSDGLVDPGPGDSAIKKLEIADGSFYILVVNDDAEAPTDSGYGIYRRPVSELGFATNVAVESVDIPALDARLWPNPTAGAFQVEVDAVTADVRIRVFDMLGREVIRRDLGRTDTGAVPVGLPAGALAPGLYAVRIESGRAVQTRMLTVAR